MHNLNLAIIRTFDDFIKKIFKLVNGLCALPGQHNRIDPVDRGTGEPALKA